MPTGSRSVRAISLLRRGYRKNGLIPGMIVSRAIRPIRRPGGKPFATPCWIHWSKQRIARISRCGKRGLRVVESCAQRAIAAGELFPQAQELLGAYNRRQFSLETVMGRQLALGGFGLGRTIDEWAVGGQVAWELDFWGRFRRAVEAADAELDASVEAYRDAPVILLGEVASAYVEIRTLEQRLEYAQRNVEHQTGLLVLAEERFQQGTATRLDVTEATTILAQTRATIPPLDAQLRQVQNRLCVLMGVPPQEIPVLLAGAANIPRVPPQVGVGIPAELIRRRPDVRRAERLVAAQSARIGMAEADLYPAFSITGTIAFEANQFADLIRSSAVAGQIGPSFRWNVLNYGRIRNNVVVQDARFQQAVTSYQDTVLKANREAEDSIVSFLRAQEQADALRQSVEAAQESRDLLERQFRVGRADFGRVLVAEFLLVTQQDQLAVAEGAIAQAFVDLFRALGGGWELPWHHLGPGSASPAWSKEEDDAKAVEEEPALPGDDVGAEWLSPNLISPTASQQPFREAETDHSARASDSEVTSNADSKTEKGADPEEEE